MKKPDLRKLDLEDLPPPESTFMQGVLMGAGISAIPAILTLIWWVHRPAMPSNSDFSPALKEVPATRQKDNSQ